MEDMYVKPGNQERGWNDPPQFSYGLQRSGTSHRNLLTRRAAPPVAGEGAPPPPSCNPLAPPPCGLAPPPLCTGRPSPVSVATPPPPSAPIRGQKENPEAEPDVEAVLEVLKRALGACRCSVPVQVCNDVEKRLRLLEDTWRTGGLSLPVRRRMDTLSQEILRGQWDSADEAHRALMVDHVTEVSQWMVGVKRLIAEARTLGPELLRPVYRPVEPVKDPTEPVQDPTELVQDPIEPVLGPTEPVQDPIEPVLGPTEPVQDPTEPVGPRF